MRLRNFSNNRKNYSIFGVCVIDEKPDDISIVVSTKMSNHIGLPDASRARLRLN